MTRDQAAVAIRKSGGRFFGATFTKANGEVREMLCSYREVAPVKQHREHTDVIAVWDEDKKAYRSIPLERLTQLRIDGKCEEIA
jgi:hypothetical protein